MTGRIVEQFRGRVGLGFSRTRVCLPGERSANTRRCSFGAPLGLVPLNSPPDRYSTKLHGMNAGVTPPRRSHFKGPTAAAVGQSRQSLGRNTGLDFFLLRQNPTRASARRPAPRRPVLYISSPPKRKIPRTRPTELSGRVKERLEFFKTRSPRESTRLAHFLLLPKRLSSYKALVIFMISAFSEPRIRAIGASFAFARCPDTSEESSDKR